MKKHLFIFFILTLISCDFKEKDTSRKNENIEIPILKISDLQDKTPKELSFIRNEIFARKNHYFTNEELRKEFSKFDWYKPVKNFKVALSEIEEKNILVIKEMENRLKIPKEFKIEEKSEIKNKDFDYDGIDDIAFLVYDPNADDEEGIDYTIYIYLSSEKKHQKIQLWDFTWTSLQYIDETSTINFSTTLEGSAQIEREYDFKYNRKLQKIELVSFTRKQRFGRRKYRIIVFDVPKGVYTVTENIPNEDTKYYTRDYKCKPIINFKNVDEKLDGIGSEFDGDVEFDKRNDSEYDEEEEVPESC